MAWNVLREQEAQMKICPLTRQGKGAKGKRCIANDCVHWSREWIAIHCGRFEYKGHCTHGRR